MGHSSKQHIRLQEAAAYTESDSFTDGQHALSLNEMHELFEQPEIEVPAFTPYIEKHAVLLDLRNMYADLCRYTNRLINASLNNKQFWKHKYQQQCDQLSFIEGKLLEVESDLS